MDYETEANVKDYLPELLAGFFDDNKLFSDRSSDEANN
jgi:CRISPR-associated protein Csh1